MRVFGCFLLVCLAPAVLSAQATITTIAGGNGFLDNIPATQARLDGVQAVAVDAGGNAYVASGTRIRRVDAATGIISTLMANGISGASFMALDPRGNLVILSTNVLLRMNLAAGTVTTLGGLAGGTASALGLMAGLAVDSAGNIYVTDEYNGKIYQLDAVTNAITRIAGVGGGGGPGPANGDGGPATQAALGRPGPIALDNAGNVFFAEQYWLRRIDGKTGIITTIAPNGSIAPSGDGGPVSKAAFRNIASLATDNKGNLYISDGPRVRKIDWTSGTVTTVAGSGQQGPYMGDGVSAVQANLESLLAIAVDAGGNLWIGDSGTQRLLVVSAATGLIRTVAGDSANGDGGPAIGALLFNPNGLAVNAQGDIYIAAGSVRRVDHRTGIISTVVPQSAQSDQNGTAITLDAAGNLFFVTRYTVERLDAATGKITTVAGGGPVINGDGGPATSATLTPSAVAVDAAGDLYIADWASNRVRRVDAATGVITTFAGNGQGQVYSGGTGPAKQVSIGVPNAIAISPAGEIYVAVPNRVLKIDPAGNLSVAAGNGGCLYAGDGGSALDASVCEPSGLAFGSDGSLLMAGAACACIRRVAADTGIIQTIAGTGTLGTSNDSIPALSAALMPWAVAFAADTLYLTDGWANQSTGRIRAVTHPQAPPLPQPPKITQITNAIDFAATYSPGAIVAVIGNYLSTPVALPGVIGPDGLVTNSLGGNQVTFDGVPGPILYASAGQINTVIPYATKPGNTSLQTQVAIQNAAGTVSSSIIVTPTSLAVLDSLVFNPDNTLNSATNPAPKGATLVMYGTGMGQTNPLGVDGAILQGPNLPSPVAQFVATVQNGTSQFKANIAYVGPLPGFIAGAMQVNVQIPDTVSPGKSQLAVADSFGGGGTKPQTIYMLTDPPVLTGISPSPVSQTLGLGNTLTITGTNLIGIVAVNFYFNGQPFQVQPPPFFYSSTATSYTLSVSFAGQSGDFQVEVVNAANQVSNRISFTVQPVGPPTITSINPEYSSGSLVATKGTQQISVGGTNFQLPLKVEIFYNGAVIATLSSDGTMVAVLPSSVQLLFDFQGNAGSYGIEIFAGGQHSDVFNFNVAAP